MKIIKKVGTTKPAMVISDESKSSNSCCSSGDYFGKDYDVVTLTKTFSDGDDATEHPDTAKGEG